MFYCAAYIQSAFDEHHKLLTFILCLSVRWVAPFLMMQPQHILVLEDDDEAVVGFAAATPDASQLNRQVRMAWLEELRNKYPMPQTSPELRTPAEVRTAA